MKKVSSLGFFVGLIGASLPFLASAQNNTLGDKSTATVEEQKQAVHKQHTSRRQRLLFRKPNVKHTAQYEFYKRIENAAKEKQRILKQMAKPQYSDFTYFGHKTRPKKHLPSQMRYCKECGIRH
jgi:galactokinase